MVTKMTNQEIDGRTNKFNEFHSNILEEIEDLFYQEDDDDDGDDEDEE